jgi:acyl carrier protein
MSDPHREISTRIRRFIQEEVVMEDAEIDDDTPLMGGVLDSLGVQMLTDFIEDEFDLELDPRDITAENMRNVRSIAHLVERTSAGSPG